VELSQSTHWSWAGRCGLARKDAREMSCDGWDLTEPQDTAPAGSRPLVGRDTDSETPPGGLVTQRRQAPLEGRRVPGAGY